MEPAKLKLLLDADHETDYEFPPDFDHQALMKKVESLKSQLDAITGKHFELDLNVQDASYFTELLILEPPVDGSKTYHYILGIRFSSFGNLFTVWSNSLREKIENQKIDEIITETEKAGFIFIDAEALAEQYTGKNKYLAGTGNWWLRFFDYL